MSYTLVHKSQFPSAMTSTINAFRFFLAIPQLLPTSLWDRFCLLSFFLSISFPLFFFLF